MTYEQLIEHARIIDEYFAVDNNLTECDKEKNTVIKYNADKTKRYSFLHNGETFCNFKATDIPNNVTVEASCNLITKTPEVVVRNVFCEFKSKFNVKQEI